MITRDQLPLDSILRNTWDKVLFMIAVSLLATFSYKVYGLEALAIGTAPTGVLGTALAILLGFRNNAAYDRWWEGRKLWGALAAESRAFVRNLQSIVASQPELAAEGQPIVQRIVYRQIALNYALSFHLRRQSPFTQLSKFLSKEELDSLHSGAHVPNTLLTSQGQDIAQLMILGLIGPVRQVALLTNLNKMTDDVYGCDRIKTTIFPRQYSYYTSVFVWLFVTLLPFGLVDQLGYLTIPATLTIGYIFFVLENVGELIENPFENTVSDVPMLSISRQTEIDLRAMIGETELPPPLSPIDGYLY